MELQLETRVSKLELLSQKLAKVNGLNTEILTELTDTIAEDIKLQVAEEFGARTKEIEGTILGTVGEAIEDKVRTAVNERGLNRSEMNKLTKARNVRIAQLLGNSNSDAYILLISFYQGAMVKAYRKQFDCSAYGDIEATRFNEALNFIHNFTVTPDYHNWALEKLHMQYRDGEIENKKKFNAYERYFGIRVA